jgi:serine protease
VADVSGYVIAVLDTGVAYEDHADASGSYIVAPSLAEVSFVAPRDFVNIDSHPNDDHQHGTHIASIIGGLGALPGVVPGVAIMPLKVLDAHSIGTWLDLVEAIHWAVDRGADVINMSLTFGVGYAPSPGMEEALETACAAGVVMVAAAGNDARTEIGWPAASPLVIAVGSGCQDDNAAEEMVAAPYTNRGVQMDILAPGGCMDRDVDHDGVIDGVIAETIGYQSPGETGYWLYAGTSQAAAVVSGAVVRMLEAGATPENAHLFMQDKADTDPLQNGYFVDGLGPGLLDIEDSLRKVQYAPDKFDHRRYHAAILPWLADHRRPDRPRQRVVSPGRADVRQRGAGADAPRACSATESWKDRCWACTWTRER